MNIKIKGVSKMVKFNSTQKFTITNIKKLPTNKAIIYKIKNSKGKNIYTGIAGRGESQNRLLAHKLLKKDKIPGASKFQIKQVKNKDIARKSEKQIIKNEKPKFNKQDK